MAQMIAARVKLPADQLDVKPAIRTNARPVVAAPIVGALEPKHIDEAIAALSIGLTDDEVARLEAPYAPRLDADILEAVVRLLKHPEDIA
jgi:aryl-alcohol dehydrogenase-like predicted oxidoreductase